MILAWIHYKLSCRQAKFPRILSQNCQKDLEGQGKWPPFSIPAETIPGCMFGANLLIPAQTRDELSCGQGKVYGRTDGQTEGRTDRWTDGETQAMTIPLRPERPWGKNHYDAGEGQYHYTLHQSEKISPQLLFKINLRNIGTCCLNYITIIGIFLDHSKTHSTTHGNVYNTDPFQQSSGVLWKQCLNLVDKNQMIKGNGNKWNIWYGKLYHIYNQRIQWFNLIICTIIYGDINNRGKYYWYQDCIT